MTYTIPKELTYQCCEMPSGGETVLIVAAGNATRMQGVDKIVAPLRGLPVIVRTMMAFERHLGIGRIVVVTREDLCAEISRLADRYMITKFSDVVKGSDTRAKSVRNGLTVMDGEETLLIHDGARPLVSAALIDRLLEQPLCDGCIPVVPIHDTVKRVTDTTVRQTLCRDELVAVQTPQRVRLSSYRQALEQLSSDASITDDAAVLEQAGMTVNTVAGDCMNLKITTPADLVLARYYLEVSDL